MRHRFQQFRDIGEATFPKHQRGLDIFAALAITMLVGLTLTGIWQFFFHESNPDWYGYVPDSGFSVTQQPPTGVAQAHGLFGLGAGIVALIGTAWFAYRIAHRVPMASLIAFGLIVFATFTEAIVRFNLIKIEGQSFEQAGPGYLQLLTNDIEYVVTDAGQTSAAPFVLVVGAHIATVPLLVGVVWWATIRSLDRRTVEMANEPERSWARSLNQPEG